MAFNVVQNYVITNQPMTVSIGETSTVSVIVARETGAILCRIALWDSFGWTGDWINNNFINLLKKSVDSSSTQRGLVLKHNQANREKCDVTLPSFLIETAICIVERWKKVWRTVLFLSAIMCRKVIHVIFIFFFSIFLPYLQDHVLLRSKNNFATTAT